MDPQAVRDAFDAQIRRSAEPETPSGHVEQTEFVVRIWSSDRDGWAAVTWSNLAGLSGADVDAVITEQVDRFAKLSRPWEWKYYSYDSPPDLPARLLAAGASADSPEALMVAEIADLNLDPRPPTGVRLRDVADEDGAAELVRVHDQVFGGDHAPIGRIVTAGLRAEPPVVRAVLAITDDGTAVSAGRIVFREGTDFAGLWGGSTLPDWRGRGVFRSLVAYRAAQAQARGFRYLQVDASPDSRPILARLGFTELATTIPFNFLLI